MSEKLVIQFGAGNVGRGFLGQLLTESDFEVVFVDVDSALIEAINAAKGYRLKLVGKHPVELWIGNVRAVNASQTEEIAEYLCRAELAATAVGQAALPQVAHVLAQGIRLRRERGVAAPLNVIVCENLYDAANVVRKMILEAAGPEDAAYINEKVGLAEAVISRMVPIVPPEERAADRAYVKAEEYSVLPVCGSGFKGAVPDIKGMVAYDDLTPYVERKLYAHNLSHALLGYFGYHKGHTYVYECTEDAELCERARRAAEEAGRALILKHGFSAEEHKAHLDDLFERFGFRELGDTVFRTTRDPIRKLAYADRLVGAARLALAYDVEPRNIVAGIRAALAYDDARDKGAGELQRMIRAEGRGAVLERVCGLDEGSPLFTMILSETAMAYRREGRSGKQ